MAEIYSKGLVSMQEIATQSEVSLYEMMGYLEAEKIYASSQSEEDIIQDIDRSTKIFDKIKMKK